jgi:pyruvate dehydrogenase E2 component (dihydrolipoamide acetyltransferase)
LAVGTRMKTTISADHRVTDGVEAAQFMQALKDILENPMKLLL